MFKLECHCYSGENTEETHKTLGHAKQAMQEEIQVEITNLQNDEYEEKYEYETVITETNGYLHVKDSDIYFEWTITKIA